MGLGVNAVSSTKTVDPVDMELQEYQVPAKVYVKPLEVCYSELNGQDIESILLKITTQDRENRWRSKVVYFDTKGISQDQQLQNNLDTVKDFLSKSDIAWASVSVTLSVAGAFAGQTIPGAIFMALSTGSQTVASHWEKTHQASRQDLGYNAERMKTFVNAIMQSLQESDKKYDDSTQVEQRISELLHRQAQAATAA